jgi:hypothetical protein
MIQVAIRFVANWMVDLRMVNVDADARLLEALPDDVVHSERVEVPAELRQRDRIADARS